jgi:hypothetical protein
MATTKESNLSNLYVELNRFGQNGEYERALKTANKSKINCVPNYSVVTASKMSWKYAPYVQCIVYVNGYVLMCSASRGY